MTEETVRPTDFEALSDQFKKLGWDKRVPGVISKWGEFTCTDTSFELKIIDETDPRFGTSIKFSLSPEASNEPANKLSFCRKQAEGSLEINGSPITKMVLLNVGEGNGIGSRNQLRLLINLFEEGSFQIAIYPTGEICSIRRSFSEEYDESVGIKTGAPVVLGY